jgi:hypothetical protein
VDGLTAEEVVHGVYDTKQLGDALGALVATQVEVCLRL